MENKIYLIYPYYQNPSMLERQIDNWNLYKGELRDKIEVIIVDDASPKSPAAPIMENCHVPKRVYRVLQNIPWAQHHARNIGAYEVEGDDSWLFMSDIDIVLPATEALKIFDKRLNPNRYHTFERQYINGNPPKFHLNTFLVKRRHYWAINGYDVDFCGTYGGDSQFLVQLNARAKQLHHGKPSDHLKPGTETSGNIITVWGYDRDTVKDANTTEWPRKEGLYRKKFVEVLNKKKKSGDFRSKKPIRWSYERVL